PLRSAAARNDGEVDLGQTELRVLRGDPDIAGEGEFEAAPQREASDGRDDGLRTALHLGAEVETLGRFAEMGGGGRLEELADVRPRAEGPFARPRDDHRLDRVVGAQG